MTKAPSRPAPLQTDTGKQKDDNIDDLGRRPDGSVEDQPVDAREGNTSDRENRGSDRH